MSSLGRLTRVLQPPAQPLEVTTASNWQLVQEQLGIILPEDYKGFVATYGTGAVDDFLWILSPFSGNDHLNLLKQATVRTDAQRQFSQAAGVENPYALYPQAGGLFPWAITDNGDVLYWLCDGLPSTWAIVVCDSQSSHWQQFQMSTCEFLTELIMKTIVVRAFPTDFPEEPSKFIAMN